MPDKYMMENDIYCYPSTNTLKNYFDIMDSERLNAVEGDIVTTKAESIEYIEITGFSLGHLKRVHKHLFGDIYPWAGELRTCDISKGDTRFCSCLYLEKESIKLEKEFTVDVFRFAESIASIYSEINVLHPFRDGNGRATRLYIEMLAATYGFSVDWSTIDAPTWIKACIGGYYGDNSGLTSIFEEVLESC